MSKNTAKRATVDYTSEEMRAARDLAVKTGRAYKAYVAKGDGSLLVSCVEATREAIRTGFLADGRDKDRAEQSVTGKVYAGYFGLSSGTEITFWTTLARALDAGVTVGDDLWNTLATRPGGRMAKRTEVAKVIADGGDLATIGAACETVKKAAATRAANRPASEKAEKGDEPVIPTTDDPVADALTLVSALSEACKRIPQDDAGRKAWAQVKKAMAEVARRETTLRKATPADLPVAI